MAVELRNRLFGQFGGKFDISPTAVFDHPTIGELAEHLVSQLPDSDEPRPSRHRITLRTRRSLRPNPRRRNETRPLRGGVTKIAPPRRCARPSRLGAFALLRDLKEPADTEFGAAVMPQTDRWVG